VIYTSEIAHQTKTIGSNLPTALYFTVSGVFSTSSVQKPSIPAKVLCENVKYFVQYNTIFGHKNVCEEEIDSNEEFSRAGLALT
jgi:hypothetical protein